MHRHGGLECGSGQVLTEAGGKELAECDPSDDDHYQRGGRSCGVSDDAAEADTDDGNEAHRHGTEDDGLQYAGVPEGHLEMLAGEDPLTELEADEIASSATGKTNAALTAALAASTRRRVGMAVKVDRIIPVAYSAVTVRTASDAEQHGADQEDSAQRAGGRVERAALRGAHGGPLTGLGDAEDGTQTDGDGRRP